MHDHDHDHDHDGALPRPAHPREQVTDAALAARSAAAGRWDVAGPAGMLSLQRAAGNAGVGAVLDDGAEQTADAAERPSPVHEVIGSGGGRPLEPDVRADMESTLGHDFGDVRVHTDQRAHDSALAVNAHAYTVGSDVVFQRDSYDPTSPTGRASLAHELTHVVQQRSGPVDGSEAPGGIRVSDPSDRFEREASATAERVAAEPAAAVQREEEPPEEEMPAPAAEEAMEEEPA